MIYDIEARDRIIDRINAAGKKRFITNWERAKWLKRGEIATGIEGGFANMVIFSPAGMRTDHQIRSDAALFFYGSNGVLAHEEPAKGGYFQEVTSPAGEKQFKAVRGLNAPTITIDRAMGTMEIGGTTEVKPKQQSKHSAQQQRETDIQDAYPTEEADIWIVEQLGYPAEDVIGWGKPTRRDRRRIARGLMAEERAATPDRDRLARIVATATGAEWKMRVEAAAAQIAESG